MAEEGEDIAYDNGIDITTGVQTEINNIVATSDDFTFVTNEAGGSYRAGSDTESEESDGGIVPVIILGSAVAGVALIVVGLVQKARKSKYQKIGDRKAKEKDYEVDANDMDDNAEMEYDLVDESENQTLV